MFKIFYRLHVWLKCKKYQKVKYFIFDFILFPEGISFVYPKFFNSGSRVKKVTWSASKNLSIFNSKKLFISSRKWSGIFILDPDPRSWIFFTHSGLDLGSRGLKGTGSRIRNTGLRDEYGTFMMNKVIEKELMVYYCTTTMHTYCLFGDGRCVRLGIELTVRV